MVNLRDNFRDTFKITPLGAFSKYKIHVLYFAVMLITIFSKVQGHYSAVTLIPIAFTVHYYSAVTLITNFFLSALTKITIVFKVR